MVKFYAPWCHYCKVLAPVYKKLATGFPSSKVIIAEVDTDEQKQLAKDFGIEGLPTLLWFEAGSEGKNPVKYSGGRDIDSLAKFISAKTGIRATIKVADAVASTQLNSNNFYTVVNDKNKNVLVKFFSPGKKLSVGFAAYLCSGK